MKLDHGFVGGCCRIFSQAPNRRGRNRTHRTGKVPFLYITGVGIMAVGGGDKADLQRIKSELLLKLQPHLKPLTNKPCLEGTAGSFAGLARVKNLFESTFFIGCANPKGTLLCTFDLEYFYQRFALLAQTPVSLAVFLTIPGVSGIG